MASPIVNNVPISSIYENHHKSKYFVNRAYQRKLVWEVKEKSKFIESLIQELPVPLILLARVKEHNNQSEIVDGLQRLEAIIAFLESRFKVKGKYFDLQRDARTKQLLEEGKLQQKQPILDEESCIRLLKYELPMSIFEVDSSDEVTRVFQRINSYGRRLTRQELRFSSSKAAFSDLVSKIAMTTRGDVSRDVILLGDMCKYSISNRYLDYGINTETIPWCEYGILSVQDIRESRDEELIGHILAFMLIERTAKPSGTTLDRIYGMSRRGKGDQLFKSAKDELEKISSDKLRSQFVHVFDEIRKVLDKSKDKKFYKHAFQRKPVRTKRQFQVLFLTLYQLLIVQELRVNDYEKLSNSLQNFGDQSGVAKDWSRDTRFAAIETLKGRIREYFVERGKHDAAIHNNHTKLEALLSSSRTEQDSYDFKIGFHRLDPKNELDEQVFEKIGKTIAAMANNGPRATNRILIGIADDLDAAERWKAIHNEQFLKVGSHYVVGIEKEAAKYGGVDKYRELLKNKIGSLKIEPSFTVNACRIESWQYYAKEVLVVEFANIRETTFFQDKIFIRQGSRNKELPKKDFGVVYQRFILPG